MAIRILALALLLVLAATAAGCAALKTADALATCAAHPAQCN